MPIYEYVCSACQHHEEILQKVGEAAPQTCPICGRENTLEKCISNTSFQLKGDGWYKDLYGSKKPDPASKPSTTPKKD